MKKPTSAELQLRIETVARLLGDKQATKTEVHDYCRKNWGVHWSTASRYTHRAREFLLTRAGKTRDDVLSEAVVFNEGVIRSSTTTTREKQDARRELNELYGIYPPRRSEVSGPEGGPVAVRAEIPIPPKIRERLRWAYREKIKREVRHELREEARKAAVAQAEPPAEPPAPTAGPGTASPEPPKSEAGVLM